MGEERHRINLGGPNGATIDTSNAGVAVAGMALVALTVFGTVKIISGTIEKIKGVIKLR